MHVANNRKYWFPAKRYGWGWGLPVTWQGWGVLLIYLALVLGGIPIVQVSRGNFSYVAYVGVLTAILIAICLLTGEPAHWRWGDRDARPGDLGHKNLVDREGEH